ncbi:MAG: ATP synthase subunit I [Desulfitobacteriaceae bacterium]
MKSEKVVFLVITSLVLLGITMTGNRTWFGVLLGYWLGYYNSEWLYRDVLISTEMDVYSAIRRLRRSFFVRLGIITFVVVGVARLQRAWLPSLAIGIAVGIPLSLIFMVRRQIMSGKG